MAKMDPDEVTRREGSFYSLANDVGKFVGKDVRLLG